MKNVRLCQGENIDLWVIEVDSREDNCEAKAFKKLAKLVSKVTDDPSVMISAVNVVGFLEGDFIINVYVSTF